MTGVEHKTVGDDETGMRLDRWFKTHYPALGHGQLEKLLRKGQVRVDGGRSKANRRLEAGQEIRIPPMQTDHLKGAAKKQSARPEDADFLREITLFEDEHVMVINKPFGLAVQGGAKTQRHIDGMLQALERQGERPRLVHRLDRDTGGVLVLAKSRRAAQRLSDAFKSRDVGKDYWALVAGAPHPREGTISLPIAKQMVRVKDRIEERVTHDGASDAKPAITDYQVLDEAGPAVSFLCLSPFTGRTHQLRVHCAAIGSPIIGDGKYGGEAAHIEGVADKLHLFCRAMTFAHPMTGQKMAVTAPLHGHMAETWSFFGFDQDADYAWPEGLR